MREPRDAFDHARTCEAEGDLKAARRSYREAAEAGHAAAAVVLGELLSIKRVNGVDDLFDVWMADSGALKAAEKWWQRGIRGLDARSARELGQLLGWDPDVVETEHRLRTAYESGDAMAGYRLARLLEERGSCQERGSIGFGEDEGWLREAGALFDAVCEQTERPARAIHHRAGSWWYPGWRLRSVLSAGRVPWGIDGHMLRTHCYALVCRAQRRTVAWLPDRLRGQVEQADDIEATYVLGIAEPSESLLRSAAEAGHRQAAFELGAIRADSSDEEGAEHWFQRAADLGHPGALYELAWDLRTTDLSAAEALCHKAAQGGNLRAAALLRVLRRGPRPATKPDNRIAELLHAWDELSGLAPEPQDCVQYLAHRSGLPREDVARVRRVRNQCAHPAERGWPAPYEVDLALSIAEALRRRVG